MPKHKKTDEAPDVIAERRAEDQDAALEDAFVEGVLPDEDRRAPEPAPLVPVPEPVAEEASVEVESVETSVAVIAAETLREAVRMIDHARGETGYSQKAALDKAVRLGRYREMARRRSQTPVDSERADATRIRL
jgi:hypothetical protein